MTLNVSEIFQSIQGESIHAGLPTTFIRLAGCNLRCAWCDTVSALEEHSGVDMTVSSIVKSVTTRGLDDVCVTGGEPLLQPETIDLVKRLLQTGRSVTIETNGSIDWTDVPETASCVVDIKCPSSGMESHNRLDRLNRLRNHDQIKFVVKDKADYVYAMDVFHKYLDKFQGPVFVSPVHNVMNPGLLANWLISDRIRLRLHLQIHKILKLK
jgi:7-carboxy-7-deazaguanine synthase